MASATRLSVARTLAASARHAFRVVYEVERFPEFMTGVTAVKVLSSGPGRRVVAWRMLIDDAPLDWTEEITYDHAALKTTFRALEGVFERFDGVWQVYPREDGSRVELTLDYDLGVPEIQDIIGPILKRRLTDNLEAMLNSIEKRAVMDE